MYVTEPSNEAGYDGDVQLWYSCRLYPAPAQREALAQTFGSARVVFNDALAVWRKEDLLEDFISLVVTFARQLHGIWSAENRIRLLAESGQFPGDGGR